MGVAVPASPLALPAGPGTGSGRHDSRGGGCLWGVNCTQFQSLREAGALPGQRGRLGLDALLPQGDPRGVQWHPLPGAPGALGSAPGAPVSAQGVVTVVIVAIDQHSSTEPGSVWAPCQGLERMRPLFLLLRHRCLWCVRVCVYTCMYVCTRVPVPAHPPPHFSIMS